MTDFPTAYITGMTRALRSAVLATESPFSFVQQVQDTGGERWEFSIDVMVQGRGFEAFANHVINKRKPFHLTVPLASQKIIGIPNVWVHGDQPAGAAVVQINGTWAGLSLKAGDFISFSSFGYHRLHQLIADAPPDGADVATLQITPRLRDRIEAGWGVEVKAPKVTLRATTKAPASIGHVIHQFSIDAVESL